MLNDANFNFLDETANEGPNMINSARIKKFIMDHNNCPFFLASLETGESVKEAFQTGKRIIVLFLFPLLI